MSWQPFSLHFKQVFDGNYRYLDRCGDLMMAAEDSLGLMPEDAKPSGCKMSLPERGISIGLDSSELTVVQEFYEDEGTEFVGLCQALVDLTHRFFSPRHVESNGFASKTYWPLASSEASLAASLKLGKGFPTELAKQVEMPARQETVDCHFGTGSMDLHLKISSATFQSMTLQKYTAPPLATAVHRRRLERLNRRSTRLNQALGHGIMLELDLVEFDPPEGPVARHFKELTKKRMTLQSRFAIS